MTKLACRKHNFKNNEPRGERTSGDKLLVCSLYDADALWLKWLKCNRTQGSAVPPPPIYDSKRPPSDCFKAGKGLRPVTGAQT